MGFVISFHRTIHICLLKNDFKIAQRPNISTRTCIVQLLVYAFWKIETVKKIYSVEKYPVNTS